MVSLLWFIIIQNKLHIIYIYIYVDWRRNSLYSPINQGITFMTMLSTWLKLAYKTLLIKKYNPINYDSFPINISHR